MVVEVPLGMEDPATLPSPTKASVFVFHEGDPRGMLRVSIQETWEGMVEVIRSRLRLLTVDAVFDSGTGAARAPPAAPIRRVPRDSIRCID